ncbi:hypothetical protein AGDE_10916 [Angomonas deanei]|nr:hypothetical protein AGDE_10916 [Angomonas deanei]|eukprot:EPY27137.1 hypothetical protein AGDE_10916 [Angomonas deanei]
MNDSTRHSADCPVVNKRLSICALAHEKSFLNRPCTTCVNHRVHFLASEVFCRDFEKKCHAQTPSSALREVMPAELVKLLEKQFTSIENFEKEVLLFATSGRTPSRTWLVTNETGAVSLINLSGNTTPLVFGFWPLAVFNTTEERLCRRLLEKSHHLPSSVEEAPSASAPPSWSRAARNPASVVARQPLRDEETLPTASLQETRLAVTREGLTHTNWDFIWSQVKSAEQYYKSDARTQATVKRRQKLEQAAAAKALRQLRDSGTSIMASDTVQIKGTIDVPVPPPKEAKKPQAPAKKPVEEQPAAAAPAKESTPAEAAPAAASDEPKSHQREDGAWVFTYSNGDVAVEHADGKKEFFRKDVTTTMYVDGTVLHQYPNRSSILERPDGSQRIHPR